MREPGNGVAQGAALEQRTVQAEIGIIGGSGLYSMPGFTNVREVAVETPFGAPSEVFVLGELEGRKVAFLARHGRGHKILPSELNFWSGSFPCPRWVR
jgi:5'-methylthioadenosine phosphorylase